MAISIWAFEVTGKAFVLTAFLFLNNIPNIIFSAKAGVIADKYNKKKVILLSDFGSFISTLGLLTIFYKGNPNFYLIGLLIFISSAFNVLHSSVTSTLTTLLVPKEKILKANGLQSLFRSTTVTIGPALSGIIYSWVGLHGPLYFDIVTFIVAILGVYLIVFPSEPEKKNISRKSLDGIKLGWQHISKSPSLLNILLIFSIINIFITMFIALVNPYVLIISSSKVLGIVLSLGNAGMILGSSLVYRFGGVGKPKWQSIYYLLICNCFLIFLSSLFEHWYGFAFFFFCFNLITPILGAASTTIWQRETPQEIQGRVFSVRQLLSWIIRPLSILLSGWIADYLLQNGKDISYLFKFLGLGGILVVLLIFTIISVKSRSKNYN